jgi:hypothetical protein
MNWISDLEHRLMEVERVSRCSENFCLLMLIGSSFSLYSTLVIKHLKQRTLYNIALREKLLARLCYIALEDASLCQVRSPCRLRL